MGGWGDISGKILEIDFQLVEIGIGCFQSERFVYFDNFYRIYLGQDCTWSEIFLDGLKGCLKI